MTVSSVIARVYDQPILSVTHRATSFLYQAFGLTPPNLADIARCINGITQFSVGVFILYNAVIEGSGFLGAIGCIYVLSGMLPAWNSLKVIWDRDDRWTVPMYKAACAQALVEQDRMFWFRFAYLVLIPITIALGFTFSALPVLLAVFLCQTVTNVTAAFQSFLEAAEPPRPDDGDAFFMLPNPA